MPHNMGTINMDNRYNGWTNYATWRVNLEIFDGLDPREMGWARLDHYDLKEAVKDYASELIEMDVREGLALDYARAFLSDVNWWEIAQHLIDDHELAEPEEIEQCE
jgi:hypothetical protein